MFNHLNGNVYAVQSMTFDGVFNSKKGMEANKSNGVKRQEWNVFTLTITSHLHISRNWRLSRTKDMSLSIAIADLHGEFKNLPNKAMKKK